MKRYFDKKIERWWELKICCSSRLVCSTVSVPAVTQREDKIFIIANGDKQAATSVFLTPSFFHTPSPPHFHSLFCPLAPFISPLRSSSTSLCSSLPPWPHSVNSDHVCRFIGSLHFSPLLRLMGCSAINEHARTSAEARSGQHCIYRKTHIHEERCMSPSR